MVNVRQNLYISKIISNLKIDFNPLVVAHPPNHLVVICDNINSFLNNVSTHSFCSLLEM